jgi:hypothetical protein
MLSTRPLHPAAGLPRILDRDDFLRINDRLALRRRTLGLVPAARAAASLAFLRLAVRPHDAFRRRRSPQLQSRSLRSPYGGVSAPDLPIAIC